MTYLVFDLETTTKELYKRTANPFFNTIVALGMKQEGMNKESHLDIGQLGWKFATYPINILIGHNIKFDLMYIWKYEFLQMWLRNGGRIWDTSLAEYMLTAQQHKFPALRDIAVNKYGCKEREKKMEKYWEAGKCTSEIPIEIVREDVENDVMDTEAIYLAQIKTAQDMGLTRLIELQMDALLATTEIEYNGFKVDRDIFEKNKEQLKIAIEEQEKKIYDIIGRYWI